MIPQETLDLCLHHQSGTSVQKDSGRPAGVVQTTLKEKVKHWPSPEGNLVGRRNGAKGPWTWTPKMASSPGRGHGPPWWKLETEKLSLTASWPLGQSPVFLLKRIKHS